MKRRYVKLIGIPILILSGKMAVSSELSDGLVDPTRPLDYRETSSQSVQTDLVLTSVMITGEVRMAVINGERVVENQMIGGAEVVSIQPGRVIVHQGDRRQELKVHKSSVKQSTDKLSTGRSRL